MEAAAEKSTESKAIAVEGNKSMPLWLTFLFMQNFFEECTIHSNDKKKKDCNFYCIDCYQSMCTNCLDTHLTHKFIQIRKYVYRHVVNLQDMKKYFDCSGVKTYLTNNNKVVPLTQKQSPSKNQPGSQNVCLHCGRSLKEPLLYCCLECKVLNIHGKGGQTELIGEPSSTPSLIGEPSSTPSSTLNADDNCCANISNSGDLSVDNDNDLNAYNNSYLDADEIGANTKLPRPKHGRKHQKPSRSPLK